jgi:predicted permease
MATVDGHPVAVIGAAFWQRQFGASRSVIGRSLTISGVLFTIVGVAESGFRGVWIDSTVDIWVPLVMQHALGYRQNANNLSANSEEPWVGQMGISWLQVIVRSSLEQRAAIVDAFARLHLGAMREIAANVPELEGRRLLLRHLQVTSFARGYSDVRLQYSDALRLLMAMVGLLLLVACANVANLLLARWVARQHEIAIKLSIGSSRGRIVRQLVIESLLLAAVGGAAGLGLAQRATNTLATTAQVQTVLTASVAVDLRVLGFCVLLSTATTLIFGLVPAIRATPASPAGVIRAGGATHARTPSMMRVLVAAQVAMSVVLVVGAALLGRSLLNLRHLDPGYDHEHVVQIRMDPLAGGLAPEELPAVYQRVAERARRVRGVTGAEVSRLGVASGIRSVGSANVEGYTPVPGERVRFMANSVGPTYFATTGMTLVQGRGFTDRDVDGRPPVAVVNESAARRYFGGIEKAIGRRMGFVDLGIEVVGVVRDARVMSLREAPTPMVFTPILQTRAYAQALDIRVAGEPGQVGEAVRRLIVETEPRLLAYNHPTLVAEALERRLTRDRLVSGLALAFAALALLLACFGLYGVLTYAVERRTREMGVRMALGAAPADLLRMVIGDGLRVTCAGVVIGLLGAIAAARLIESLLFRVAPSDPITYVAVVATLLAVTSLASFLPAQRAARVDPVVALRAE